MGTAFQTYWFVWHGGPTASGAGAYFLAETPREAAEMARKSAVEFGMNPDKLYVRGTRMVKCGPNLAPCPAAVGDVMVFSSYLWGVQ